jgi:cytoskeletal protein CcmA (bactofilin family)
MFGSKKTETSTSNSSVTNKTSSNAADASTGGLNSLVKGTIVEGSVTTESDIRIDGTIKGVLVCKAKVIIGVSGFVDGDVKCQNAVIEGKFTGKLRVEDTLSVKETAEVTGDIQTGKLLVQTGAIFNVTCNMRTEASNVQKNNKEMERSANGTANKQPA